MFQTSLLGNNPFAVLTAVVAPAILTNASSVLALGTSNRLARVVDRTRVVYADLAGTAPGSTVHAELFAASALVSVGGSIATYYGRQAMFEVAAGLAVMTGASAVLGLVAGCTLMVDETRMAVQSLAKEAEIWERQTTGSPTPILDS